MDLLFSSLYKRSWKALSISPSLLFSPQIPTIITILDLKIHKHATKGYNMRGNVVIYVDISI